MRKQTIIWTALPFSSDGPVAAGTKLRLSAFVSPRLWDSDPTVKEARLDDFGDDFVDWPKTLETATFEVEFNGGPPLAATDVTRPRDPRVWQGLFKSDTRVVPHRFRDLSGAEILTFHTLPLYEAIKGVFQTVGTAGDGSSLPERGTLAANPVIRDLGRTFNMPDPPKMPEAPTVVVGTPKPPVVVDPDPGKPGKKDGCAGCGCGCLSLPFVLLRRLLRRIGLIALLPVIGGAFGGNRSHFGPERFAPDDGGAVPVEPPISANRAAFDQFQEFIKPPSEESVNLPATDLSKTYDFHQMVSTLGDYPILMRYCGLVIDLEVTLPAAVPATGTVRILPKVPDVLANTKHYSPRTHYELGTKSFFSRSNPSGGEIRNGLLRVDDAKRFAVMQLDVAGGAIKLQNAATALKQEATPTEPEQQGLPALQTAGLSLVRPNFADDLKSIFVMSAALNNGLSIFDGSQPPSSPDKTDEVFAENVLRGYRVDIWDGKSGRWHSLCRRVGNYRLAEAPGGPLALPPEEDEGFVETAATEPVKEAETLVLRVHESLFTWNGWSLAAPRYGQTIMPDLNPDRTTKVAPPPNDAVTQFKLETSFTPRPGSLPRLRYGYEYRMRVRAVDLAGNSTFGPEDDLLFQQTPAEVTEQVRYRRFEPVAPPMLMLQAKPAEGESLERLVVRSQFDDPAAAIEAQQTNRHIIPPKTSQQMAEQHRKFDAAGAMPSDAVAYERAARESGSIIDRFDPVTNKRERLDGVVYIAEPKGAERPEHEFWLQTEDSFDIPYLPDPYARGVLFMGLPGLGADDINPGGTIANKIAFDGPWPDTQTLLLRVRGIPAGQKPQPPQWDAGPPRILLVELPQGETHAVRVSSYFDPADLDNLAVWKWLTETGVAHLNVLQARAGEGRTWLHLPYRTLVLVHAVQQPLTIPTLAALTATRPLGGTRATVTGTCKIDAKSTEKIDLHGSWTDPIDIPGPNPPTTSDQSMHVAQVKAVDPKNDDLGINVEHAVGDTKYHHVTYSAIASTRFREYFNPATNANDLVRPVPGSEPDSIGEADVPNSARPAAPKLQYIVPTFAWKRTSAPGTFTSVRRGGGLRVYLDRPWWSSGDKELLGVTLRPAAIPPISPAATALTKYISEWGMDPLWPATATKPLTAADFVNVSKSGTDLLLAELEAQNTRVDVVGFEPHFDPERNLWYCDLMLEPQAAYFPMVRLALVRFQPNSVDGAHISPVIPADYVQVVPLRQVQCTVTDAPTNSLIEVTVNGPAYFSNKLEKEGVPQMILRIERPSGRNTGDELDWEPVSVTRFDVDSPNPANTVWKAQVRLAPRPTPMRVVVLEAERYRTDPNRLDRDPLGVLEGANLAEFGHPLFRANAENQETLLGYRVTFAEAVEMP